MSQGSILSAHLPQSALMGGSGNYRHTLTEADHAELLDMLCGVRGRVALSGCPSVLYDERLKD